MQNKALVVIDIQNDITKNYKEIINNINRAIDWAVNNSIHVVLSIRTTCDCRAFAVGVKKTSSE